MRKTDRRETNTRQTGRQTDRQGIDTMRRHIDKNRHKDKDRQTDRLIHLDNQFYYKLTFQTNTT